MWLCARGHVATAQELIAHGTSRRHIVSAVRAGRLLRLRRGVYGCAHLDADQRTAVAAGGLIDCVSALARHEDVWAGVNRAGLHLRLEPHAHSPQADAVVHWRKQAQIPTHAVEVSPVDALLQAMSCLDPYDALAAVESALHLGYLNPWLLDSLIELAPERMRRTLDRIDPRSQSGFETHTRVMLVDAGHTVECQVSVPGAGVLDLLVDDCVGVETDGRTWHEHRFLEDRTKDIRVGAWGIPVLRLARSHIFETWPETLATIERMIEQSPRRA